MINEQWTHQIDLKKVVVHTLDMIFSVKNDNNNDHTSIVAERVFLEIYLWIAKKNFYFNLPVINQTIPYCSYIAGILRYHRCTILQIIRKSSISMPFSSKFFPSDQWPRFYKIIEKLLNKNQTKRYCIEI